MDNVVLTVIILGSMVLFVTRWVPTEVTAILIIASLALTGILEPGEALQGFSSTATITVAAMFILSAGLARAGVVEILTSRLSHCRNLRLPILLLLFAGVIAIFSAIANNTPVIVIMVPVLLTVCRESNYMPSKLFMPASFFSILGGTCTLIGTSTNILVDDLFRRAGAVVGMENAGFAIFDFTPLGVVYLIIGVIAIVLLAPRLLPDRPSLTTLLPGERGAKFVTELVLGSGTSMVGRRVGDVWDQSTPVRLLEMIRGEEIILMSRAKDLVFEPQDALIVEGSPKEISAFLDSFEGLELASVVEDEHRVPMKTIQLKLVEAVVLPDSPFVGRFVRDLGLNRLYGVKVMAVQRHGKQHRYQIRAMRLHEGDVLLLQADDHGAAALRETGAVLIVEGVEETVARRHKMPIAIAIMVGVIGSAAAFGLPLVVAALLGAGLMLLTRCVRIDEASRALDLSVILLLAGTIPLGMAMLKTGLAESVVHSVIGLVGGRPLLTISAIYLLTAALTSFMSNNAAAVLLTPIAFDLAVAQGIDPHPLLIAVAFGASACFSTPIAYQTNAIVLGPGGYTFGDYLRLGIPLTLIMWLTATLLIPVFWPL